MLFVEFCGQLGLNQCSDMFEKSDELDDGIKVDDSDYVCVDGEEGDYGIIRFISKCDGRLLAARVVCGGDREWVDFTRDGFDYFKPHFDVFVAAKLDAFRSRLSPLSMVLSVV